MGVQKEKGNERKQVRVLCIKRFEGLVRLTISFLRGIFRPSVNAPAFFFAFLIVERARAGGKEGN